MILEEIWQILTDNAGPIGAVAALVTVAGAVLGVLFWIYRSIAASCAARAADKAVEVTSDTARRQWRAYVHPINANLIMKEDGYIKGSVTIKNAGQTPAHRFESRCTLTFSPNLLLSDTPDIEHVDKGRSVATLPPKGTVDASCEGRAKLVPEYLSKLAARELAIFLHGRLTYRDAFGNSQITDFRYMFTGSWGGQKPLVVCEEGNEAT